MRGGPFESGSPIPSIVVDRKVQRIEKCTRRSGGGIWCPCEIVTPSYNNNNNIISVLCSSSSSVSFRDQWFGCSASLYRSLRLLLLLLASYPLWSVQAKWSPYSNARGVVIRTVQCSITCVRVPQESELWLGSVRCIDNNNTSNINYDQNGR